ncbi:translation machinery-associated protein 22 [Parastagonospora nodorum]|uniref:Translation machinery-associated protein 22 n=1 Tax=Phaeosphaeria nodorum (strain SN15 / ATCC MYA-4574 / FGSC 10173) TaxID=321614 RepID=A0A7U2F4Y8_PHANO|nr:translation machinery-associated protein 22 [Parastagonospora nodorum]QRC96634.1 translation machinery-associated protein 22 [Parastagonospora nodorum SN15]KAH3929933.1 translation machinery-associated protein 22 [Parastagonospora nodorum]KAH3955544.1 translation machinery-associated protein 22 [Parastagonospora nodorum]KAH3976874.1 translation machinery-associated protein 22 [Parastagonospora nodorum]
MFKKKPNIKPLSPLKSSDRRRTADQIIADFGIEVPVDANADPEDKTASTAGLTALRKSLLPENALSARFTTTAGPDLKQVSGTVYVGSHEGTSGEQRILWVKLFDKMYPTVYTLWHNPRIVPLLYTPLVVVEKMQAGADLMTPGLQRGPPFPKKATKGAIVAIASLEAPTVPMAVGTCEIDVSALDKVQGMKGQAVSTFHWAGDELWSWSSAGKAGTDPPDIVPGWDDEQDEDTSLAERTAAVDLDDQEGGVSLDANPTERSEAEKSQGVEGEDAPSNHDFIDVVDDKELTTKEIDDAFKNAFLFGVRHHMEHNRGQPNYGLDFPLSQSHVMAQLVQPFLPTYTPARTASLQIKKSSWKNIRKFIRYLDKQQIAKCKDRDGNEVVITDIDFKDRQVEAFVPYRLPKKDAPASANGKSAAPMAAEGSVGQKLKLVSLLRPKEKLAPIFHASKADPRGLYTPAELKQILLAYVEAENLIDAKNKRLVRLNPQLADGLLGSSAADNAALSSGNIPRDALAERMVAASSPFYAILRNDADITDTKPKAGAPPKIQITLETRSGNKTVSKVHGFEPYHIAPQPLADELRKTCAGSTSIDKLQGSSPKNPVMEVMVQGPQKDAIIKALEKRGVHKNWVEVVDKTKKKK